MNLISWNNELNRAIYDREVGIKIIKLNGNSEFNTYLTVLDAKNSVKLHYHKHGDEYYHIIEGSGLIKLKNMLTGEESVTEVKAKYSFTIGANILHQLENNSDNPLTLMFSCPATHLEIDRYFP